MNSTYSDFLRRTARKGDQKGIDSRSPVVMLRPVKAKIRADDFFSFMQNPNMLPRGFIPYLHQTDIGKLLSHRLDLVEKSSKPLSYLPDFATALQPRLLWRNLWLSPRGVKTDAHFDANDNLLMTVEGRKDLLLLPPTAWEELGYKPQRQLFPSAVLRAKQFFDQEDVVTGALDHVDTAGRAGGPSPVPTGEDSNKSPENHAMKPPPSLPPLPTAFNKVPTASSSSKRYHEYQLLVQRVFARNPT